MGLLGEIEGEPRLLVANCTCSLEEETFIVTLDKPEFAHNPFLRV